jgi:Spy/CpxP family protein refolding chaperone
MMMARSLSLIVGVVVGWGCLWIPPGAAQNQTEADVTQFLTQLQPPASPAELGPGSDRLEWLPQLNLTPEQLQQLNQIRQQNQGTIAQRRAELQAARQQLRTLLASDASEAEVQTQYEKVRGLTSEIADLGFETILSVREILTVDQRQQLLNALEDQGFDRFPRFPRRPPNPIKPPPQ